MENDTHCHEQAKTRPMRRDRQAFYLLLLITLIVRIVYVLRVTPEPVLYDAVTYDTIALNISRHGAFSLYHPRPTAYVTPGYPLFLAGIYALFGESNFAVVRVFQALLSIAVIFFVFYSVREMTDNRAIPWLAAIGCILYIPFTDANQFILTEVLFSFVLIVSFYAMVLEEKYQRTSYRIFFGAMLGVSCLVRPILFFLPAFILGIESLVFLISRSNDARQRFTRRFKDSILVYGVLFLTLCPWIARNYLVFRSFIPFSTEGGNPLYLGTVYQYAVDGKSMHIQGLSEIEQNRVWMQKARENFQEEIRKAPGRYFLWYLSKIQQLCAYPYLRGFMYWKAMKLARMTHVVLIWFCSIGLLVSFLGGGSVRRISGIWIVYYILFHIPFIGSSRYFFPVMPLCMIFLAFGIIFFKDILNRYILTTEGGPTRRKKIIFGVALWIFLLYFMILLKNNFYQKSGILNLSVHPVLLSKMFGSLMDAAIFVFLVASLYLLSRIRILRGGREILACSLFVFLFYLGPLTPLTIRGFELGMTFEVPVRRSAEVEQIIDLPAWAKGYKDPKLVVSLANSDSGSLDYQLGINVNDTLIYELKKGDHYSGAEIILPLTQEMVESNPIMKVKIKVESESFRNHPILKGTVHCYRGISLLDGREDDLSREPGIQGGTYNIGLRLYGKSRLKNVYYWRGSRRSVTRTFIHNNQGKE